MTTFRKYLRALPAEKSAVGNVIASFKADKSFPNIDTWNELRLYLNEVGASHEMMVASRMLWRRYKEELQGR